MKKNGFTLMELIIVIVILGVLAVTAAPRFLNIQESAREAVLEGVAGAMEGVITQVTSKAIIAGLDPDASNPGDQSNYVIDFGIGRTTLEASSAPFIYDSFVDTVTVSNKKPSPESPTIRPVLSGVPYMEAQVSNVASRPSL